VIYVTAERVPNAMYRAWAEIEQDGRRVERSGLVGPRFANPDDALGYALEWARQWIDRQGVPSQAAASAPSPEVYARPLPPVRSMPPVPTVTSAGVRADAPVNVNGMVSGTKSGATSASMSTPAVSSHLNKLSKPLANPPMANPLHAQVGGLRAPLRRYPGDAATDSTERFPGVAEFISHVG
jgi:hypothetical protein